MENNLCDRFSEIFDVNPEFVVRCPGRVNLIGEHIDYCGYGVLPMALEQSVFAAVRVNETGTKIRLRNTNSNYLPFDCEWANTDIDKSSPMWHQYFLCGHRGMCEYLAPEKSCRKIGMDVLIHGEIPPRAGLSSSSALVCCAAICTSHVAAGEAFTDVSRKSVAELCAQCERYIGTEGGGMDQAICLLGEEGKALNITFNPLRTTSVFLPPGYVFVVCHSCVQMNKAATSHFNERVVECRLASQVLAKLGGMDWRSIRTLSELQEKCGCDLAEMVKTVESVLHKEPYTKEEICTILSIDNHTFRHLCLNSNTEHMTDFKLSQRAIHVYSEANRVKEFVSVCNSPQSSVEKLGDLMNGSHQSCSQLYECSCPDLDELVSVCRESGAIGSRLTGAGWGGCTVSLVLEEDVGDFLKNVKEKYYEKSDHRIGYFNEAVFVTKPANGATVQLF